MYARDHTQRQLDWFADHAIGLLDLAVRRPDGTFICKGSTVLEPTAVERYLPWVRYENARQQADVYLRPARGYPWPILFLDDVAPDRACALARQYSALLVLTSRAGGCHVWLAVSRPLTESERAAAQRHLQVWLDSDPASTSGEHWGRLAGMKNHKRAGCWVNVLLATIGPRLECPFTLPAQREIKALESPLPPRTPATRDESVAEFAWCCHRLREGWAILDIEAALALRAAKRGKRNPLEYARRTVRAAERRLQPK